MNNIYKIEKELTLSLLAINNREALNGTEKIRLLSPEVIFNGI